MSHSFSPIQNGIFSRLKNAKVLRYSEMQPRGVPNDLFNYHLQFLVKKGYVNRLDDGYMLSELGVKHVADYNPPIGENGSANLFKINVLTVVSRISKGKLQILNQLRTSNPSYGKIGVPGGVVRKGESILDAATRKLKVETGLDARFRLIGIQRRMMYVKGELFSDVVFPIAYSDSASGELLKETEYGHNMWVDIDKAIENDRVKFDSIRKLPEVLQAIKDAKINSLDFFYEEDIQSDGLN